MPPRRSTRNKTPKSQQSIEKSDELLPGVATRSRKNTVFQASTVTAVDEVTPVQKQQPLPLLKKPLSQDISDFEVDEITPVPKPLPLLEESGSQEPTHIEIDEITPVPKPLPLQEKPHSAHTSDIEADEIIPVPASFPNLEPPISPDLCDIENEITPMRRSLAPPSFDSVVKENAFVEGKDTRSVERPGHSRRQPFQLLQTGETCSTRTNLVTYGKRRREHGVQIPSSRALGVLHIQSPCEESDMEGTGEECEKGEDIEEEEIEKEESNEELKKFMKEQRALWAVVDDVDLEEEFD